MLRFRDKRPIASADELTPIERDQLRVAGQRYDSEDLPAEQRLVPVGPDDYMEGSFAGSCTLWRVVDGDSVLYDAWFYMGDSGTVFRAGSTDDVAAVIQGGLQCRDPALRSLLGAGMVEAQLLPRGDMSYDEFSTVLAAEEGVVVAPILAEGTMTTPKRPVSRRAPTVAERPSAKRKTSAKAKKPSKKSATKKKRASTKSPRRKRKKPATRRRSH